MSTQRNEFGLPNIVVPAEVLFNKNLSPREMLLFGFLNNLARNEYGYCWSGNRFLSRLIGVAVETVSTMISKLNKEQYVYLEYETDYKGRQTRKIFINAQYPQIYEETIKQAQGKLKAPLRTKSTPLKDHLNGPSDSSEQPLRKSRKNIETEIDTEIDMSSSSDDASSADGSISSKYITPSLFEQFWKLYPRKVNKGKAKTAWEKLCRKKDRPTWRTIKRAIRKQKETEQWEDPKFVPHPTTWLNNQRWLDDPTKMNSKMNFRTDQDKPQVDTSDPPIKTILDAYPHLNNGTISKLAANVEQVKQWIQKVRKYHQEAVKLELNSGDDPESHWVLQNIVSAKHFVDEYIEWLEEQDWLKGVSANLFNPENAVFLQYKNYLTESLGVSSLLPYDEDLS